MRGVKPAWKVRRKPRLVQVIGRNGISHQWTDGMFPSTMGIRRKKQRIQIGVWYIDYFNTLLWNALVGIKGGSCA